MKKTYFTPKNELKGSCYFEFQIGKHQILNSGHWLDNSLYLHMDRIAPFTRLIIGTHPNKTRGFDYHGITYLNRDDGESMIKNLREFGTLLASGKNIFQSLEAMKLYDFTIDNWHEGNTTSKLKLDIVKNTAEELANWAEKIFTKNKFISICGI